MLFIVFFVLSLVLISYQQKNLPLDETNLLRWNDVDGKSSNGCYFDENFAEFQNEEIVFRIGNQTTSGETSQNFRCGRVIAKEKKLFTALDDLTIFQKATIHEIPVGTFIQIGFCMDEQVDQCTVFKIYNTGSGSYTIYPIFIKGDYNLCDDYFFKFVFTCGTKRSIINPGQEYTFKINLGITTDVGEEGAVVMSFNVLDEEETSIADWEYTLTDTVLEQVLPNPDQGDIYIFAEAGVNSGISTLNDDTLVTINSISYIEALSDPFLEVIQKIVGYSLAIGLSVLAAIIVLIVIIVVIVVVICCLCKNRDKDSIQEDMVELNE